MGVDGIGGGTEVAGTDGGGTGGGATVGTCLFCSTICCCFLLIGSSLTALRAMGLMIPTGTAGGSLLNPLLLSMVSIFGGGVGGTIGGTDCGVEIVCGGTGGCGACCLSGKYGFDAGATCFFLKLKLNDSPLACLILSMESWETILMPSSMSMAEVPLFRVLLVLKVCFT